MYIYRSFRKISAFLIATAITAVLWFQIGDCVAVEQESKVQKLKEEMRMPWSGAKDVFLREWLVCGVFPSPPRPGGEHPQQNYDIDFLQEMGGEASARPVVGQAVKRPDGSIAAWIQYNSDSDIINFINVFRGQQATNVIAYAYTTVNRDEAGKAILALGSDDSVKVWLNGNLVHDHRIGRGVQKDEDIVPVAMEKGDNSLLIKVENGTGDWGFVLRVLNETQALALEMGEIQPRIEEPPKDKPDLLIVNTDAGLGKIVPETIHVDAVAAGGKIVASAEVKRGESVRFETKDWPSGPYEIRVSKRTPEGYRIFRHLPWYKGDWLKKVHELLDKYDKLPEKSDEASVLRCRVIGQLVLNLPGGDLSAEFKPDDWRKIHSPLMEYCELELGDSACIRPNGFIRLAWLDEIDDSPQFARAYLPPDYDANVKWPMVVVLHGYNSSNPKYINWWGVTERHNSIAERHNVIVIEPHGRGNTMYNGIGDIDVLKAIQVAKEKFNVAEDRVYLMGYSMGGGGTWHVGTRHPELFAAIGPIYGGWDYHIEMAEDEIAKLTPRQRFEAESWSSFAQVEALLSTPVFVNHGDSDDLVNVDYSRYAVRMLQRWGYNVRYWEHPGGGHGGFECEDELVRWFLTHRLEEPRQVRVRSAYLKSASAHWVKVEQQKDPFAFIHVDARITDRHTIRLNTENVLQIRLTPGEKLIDHSNPVRVIWNGEDAGTHPFSSDAITLQVKDYTPAKFHKTPQIAGPIEDVTTTPFAIVVGTISKDPKMRRFCQLRAEATRDEWKTWQHVEPRFFLDTEITDNEIENYSLQLFGGPNENMVTQKLIQQIPLKIGTNSITIGGQKFATEDASVSMVYPNPLNPNRYVSITAGNSPTGMFFTDRLPDNFDFVISETRVIGEGSDTPFEKGCIAAGCFNYNWQYDEKYVLRGDPDVRANAPIRKAPKYLTADVKDERLMLSELLETQSSGSFTYMERDLNWQGKPIILGGKTYVNGISVEVWHEPCFAIYDLTGGDWAHLRATIGIEIDKKPEELEQKEKDGTRVYFVVHGDGKELYRSPTFQWDSEPAEMDVDITGVKMLELLVGNEATWYNAASSVNWAEVRLEK
jgi:predicted esterase